MIRRILITDDAGRPMPVPAGAFPAMIALASSVLGVDPAEVRILSSGYDTGFRFDADGVDLDLPDGVLSDAGHAQRLRVVPP